MNMAHFSNLPDKFPVSNLATFDFGAPDGKDDPLLEACALQITPITEFLEENKSIVVGERGTGKTALFRLLSDGKLRFRSTEKFSQIYVAIDEELGYKTLREHVVAQVKDSTKSPHTSHRIVWELYFFSRCIESLTKKFSSNSRFESLRDRFYKTIGWTQHQRVGLLDILKGTKKTVGVKLEGGHLGYVIPNFYTSVEPAKGDPSTDSTQLLDVPLLKSELNSFLKDTKTVVYLLVDKLDEFVSGEEYETQKEILQALVQCWRDYQSYPNIKLKLFIRRDLYERLDFSAIGRDKIDPKKVELRWSAEDIRQFAAFRIFHNLAPCLKKKGGLRLECDEKSLTIDKAFLKEIKALDAVPNDQLSWVRKLRRVYLRLRAHLKQRKRDEYDARTINIHDAAFQALITVIFPTKVTHVNKSNKQEHIDLSEYLASHFQFASGFTTPRVILLYLQKCLENAKAYYRNNPDQQILLNEKGEYPVFLREQMVTAYHDVRELCLTTILGLNREFEKAATMLIQHMNKGKCHDQITFKEAKKIIGKSIVSDTHLVEIHLDEALRKFFAFYEHAGLFRCINRALPPESRTYDLPIFFQRVPLGAGPIR
ncbi:MAG: hypothetical protein IPM27_01050 [Nitrosomonadales bacterium]|nr:hypothetical protein [Nitrosomonadales bacterium]